jgi:hypothetical protein
MAIRNQDLGSAEWASSRDAGAHPVTEFPAHLPNTEPHVSTARTQQRGNSKFARFRFGPKQHLLLSASDHHITTKSPLAAATEPKHKSSAHGLVVPRLALLAGAAAVDGEHGGLFPVSAVEFRRRWCCRTSDRKNIISGRRPPSFHRGPSIRDGSIIFT